MKKNAEREFINADMTGASSHVYPYGNVIQVKEDVRLWGYQIQVGTPAGTFDSVIYEWNNGCIGEPLFREVIDCTANTFYNLSYRGTRLQAGKKYYIGRNDPQRNNSSNGTAGVWRKTGMPGADFKYITTLGGSQFYSPAIDFPSTWYYIFNLEVERRYLKPARLFSDDNLVAPLSSDMWKLRSGTTYTRFEGRRLYWNSNADYAGVQVILSTMGIPDSMFQGKTITFGGQVHPNATVMFFYKRADGTPIYIGVSKVTDNGARTMVIPLGASELRLYVQSDAGGRGELWCEDVFVKISDDKTYKAYSPNLKPAKLLPKKNLIPDFYDSGWFDDATVSSPTVSIYSDNPYGMRMDIPFSASGRLIWIPVQSGKTYTFSFGKCTGLYRLYRRKVNNHDVNMVIVQDSVPKNNYSFTVDDTYNGFITLRLTYGAATSLWYENLQLEEGSATAFEKLSLTKLKPAILYPKKNLFDGIIESGSFDSFGAIGASNVNVRGLQFMSVKGGTQYTFSVVGKTNITPRVYWYTVDKVFISSALGASQTSPANAAFARWHSGSMDVNDAVQFEQGSVATSYETYSIGMKAL